MPTTLTLSPAFGGTSYGPFTTGNVSIGSDAQCMVLVSGALPLHAWVVERPGGWTVHPGTPGAVIFVSQKGRVSPVKGPVDLVAGDSFALGSRDGVSFRLGGAQAAAPARAPAPARSPAPRAPIASGPAAAAPRRPPSGPRRGMPTAGALADEVVRQAEVEAMRYGPMQQLRQAIFRYNAGTLFHPRYIVAALFAMGGSAFVACGGIAGWIWAHL